MTFFHLRNTTLSLFLLFSALPFLTLSLPSPHHSKNGSWTSLPSLPSPRQEHTTIFLPPSTIGILGGVLPNSTSASVSTTPLMQFFSLTNQTWHTTTPLPVPLNHANAAVVSGRIYLLGGLADSTTPPLGWRAVPQSWVFDPETEIWSPLPNMPSPARGSAAVGVYEGRIYLAGGMTELQLEAPRLQDTVADVSVFDTVTGEWVEVPEAAARLPEGRDHAGSAVVGGEMYVLGGRERGQANVKDTVFVLDFEDLEKGWRVRGARMPTPRGGVAAGVVGDVVYVFGGEGNKETEEGVFAEVEGFDTRGESWERVEGMRRPRHGTYAVGVEGKVYVPGGGVVQGAGPVADFDVFEP